MSRSGTTSDRISEVSLDEIKDNVLPDCQLKLLYNDQITITLILSVNLYCICHFII